MALHIIVDGYNLIRQSAYLSEVENQDLQLGREALIDQLAAYKQVRGHAVTVVFDGTRAPHDARQKNYTRGIEVIYSRRGELADTVIKSMAARERQQALVVSSDRAVADFCAARGSATLSSPEFEQRLMLTVAGGSRDTGYDACDGWTPSTRKKGPRRKPSKRERRRRRKIAKL